MTNLRKIIEDAEKRKVAVGHFNISDIATLNAICGAARELDLPVIIGVSEGEREFIGTKKAAALIHSLRDDGYPVFLNADHTYSLDKIKEAVAAGYDAVIFDGAKLPLEENIKKTREVVDYVKSANPGVLVEAELGYIGVSSKLLEVIPEGAAIEERDLPTADDAARFVKETGIDLLAPAVGNIHGMLKNVPNPNLNIKRIAEIRQTSGVPLVLHGGSGLADDQFVKAIQAGISVVHINTELRLAWRQGIEKALKDSPEEITPYKLLPGAVEAVRKIVLKRLKLFNGMV